jgi:hypothetical protein
MSIKTNTPHLQQNGTKYAIKTVCACTTKTSTIGIKLNDYLHDDGITKEPTHVLRSLKTWRKFRAPIVVNIVWNEQRKMIEMNHP